MKLHNKNQNINQNCYIDIVYFSVEIIRLLQ